VQAGRGRAAGVAGGEPAEQRTRGDGGAGPDGDRERLVRRAQAAGVVDRDHAAAGQHAGVDHDAGARGEHRVARRAGQIDPAVARPVRVCRRVEQPRHRRPPRQRPPPRPSSARRRRAPRPRPGHERPGPRPRRPRPRRPRSVRRSGRRAGGRRGCGRGRGSGDRWRGRGRGAAGGRGRDRGCGRGGGGWRGGGGGCGGGRADGQGEGREQAAPPGPAAAEAEDGTQSHAATVRRRGPDREGQCRICGQPERLWTAIWREEAAAPYTRCAARHGGSTSRVLLPPLREVATTLGLPAAGARTAATPDTRAAATRSPRQPRKGPRARKAGLRQARRRRRDGWPSSP
jgi:hypothetical protein